MTVFLEYFMNSCDGSWILLVFILAIFIRIFLGKNRSLVRYLRRASHSNHVYVCKDSCTSLSCVRCSKSVFSTETLLRKWDEIEATMMPTEGIKQRMKKALERDRNVPLNSTGEGQAPTVFFLEDLPSKICYTSVDYPEEVSVLERKAGEEVFLKEFLEIYKDLGAGWVLNRLPFGEWYLFHLVNQGVWFEENCRRCPRTVEIIEELRLFMSNCAFGNVMFSVLLPGTAISCHCGPTNVRIRCHVPLKIPQGCFIGIAGEERTWQENKVLIFDDSFSHEVYHHGSGSKPRVVLMIDLWHPALSFKEKEIIKTLFPPY